MSLEVPHGRQRAGGCELRWILHDPIAKTGAWAKARADAVTSKRRFGCC
jgi:hypothetical protein